MREKHTDLRIVKTREALSKALITLLSKKAFQDVRISELCDEAGVSRATFYNNFSSMDEVFAFFLQTMWDPILEQVKKETREKHLIINKAYYRFVELTVIRFEPLHEVFMSILKVNPSSQVFDCLNTYFNKAIYEVMGEFSEYDFDMPQDMLVSYIAGGFTGLLLHMYSRAGNLTRDEKIYYIYHLTFEIYFLYNMHRKGIKA